MPTKMKIIISTEEILKNTISYSKPIEPDRFLVVL